jgi:hypothetical protein
MRKQSIDFYTLDFTDSLQEVVGLSSIDSEREATDSSTREEVLQPLLRLRIGINTA